MFPSHLSKKTVKAENWFKLKSVSLEHFLRVRVDLTSSDSWSFTWTWKHVWAEHELRIGSPMSYYQTLTGLDGLQLDFSWTRAESRVSNKCWDPDGQPGIRRHVNGSATSWLYSTRWKMYGADLWTACFCCPQVVQTSTAGLKESSAFYYWPHVFKSHINPKINNSLILTSACQPNSQQH